MIQPVLEQDQGLMIAHLDYLKMLLRDKINGQIRLRVRPELEAGSALERIVRTFGLSSFEQDVSVLCAGVEFDGEVLELVTTLQGPGSKGEITFALALSLLDQPHWSALTPDRPLRAYSLIELGPSASLTQAPLRIEETILHFLTGLWVVDPRLDGFSIVRSVEHGLVESQRPLALRLKEAWLSGSNLLQLVGGTCEDARTIAFEAARAVGVELWFGRVPPGTDLRTIAKLLDRTLLLFGGALLLKVDATDREEVSRTRALLDAIQSPVCLWAADAVDLERPIERLDLSKPTPNEQRDLWLSAFEDAPVEELVSNFDLGASEVRAISQMVTTPDAVWDACRRQTRRSLDGLAQRIESKASIDDLILPPRSKRTLQQILVHVRQRTQVYEDWGFSGRDTRGFGVAALFTGQSGTGKTMAAEVLAAELRLDLFRVDLSTVVSKYIGETEKNLRRVFDAAEAGGAVLLFDEADALFGKRSEVKDSHDRYANIEVSYLLQRMESYRGVAILTTNLKGGIDPAFLRRLRFVVAFPFPDPELRRQIWERAFPSETPIEDLDFGRLSQLNVAGGNIRNIALSAAFLAADASTPVTMSLLLEAARTECGKLERPLSESEVAGWV